MLVDYQQPHCRLHAEARELRVSFQLVNRSQEIWRADEVSIGWQIYDPETGTFILEGEWLSIGGDLAVAEIHKIDLVVTLPPEKGRYHVYLSPIHASKGWFYAVGEPFFLIDAFVESRRATLLEAGVTTVATLSRRKRWRSFKKAFTQPIETIWRNRSLIRSMVRRDILARYRGSFGDVLWTVLNPLLLMATYFFVFGIVLPTRFGASASPTEFVVYFLAGMLPWLAFTEAVGRSPYVIVEHRNFVKKLVFPVEILPVTQVISGLVTQAFATGIFLLALMLIRGGIPATVLWLPILLIPQLLFTVGLAWFLAASGVYMRDLGQIIGFLLTLWFFLTPICYPEASLPPGAVGLLTKNPIYVLVRGYRNIFLESTAPAFGPLWKLWLVALICFFGGYAWFYKLRKTFADVI